MFALACSPARPATAPARPTRQSSHGGSRISRASALTSETRAAPPAPDVSTSQASSEALPPQPRTGEAEEAAPPPATLTLTLTSTAARAGLRLSEIWDGTAPAIVVTAVADELAGAGITPGARLVSLPHPTRRGERWVLTPGNAPISRVRDLIRVARSVTLDMEFSVDPIPADAIAAWVEAQAAAAAARAAAGEEGEEEELEEEEATTTTAAPVIPDVPTTPPSYLPSPEAVAYEAEARKQAVRLAARAARNAAEDARDDTPLLLWTGVAFLGPAAAILGWAYASGLLDSLATHQY